GDRQLRVSLQPQPRRVLGARPSRHQLPVDDGDQPALGVPDPARVLPDTAPIRGGSIAVPGHHHDPERDLSRPHQSGRRAAVPVLLDCGNDGGSALAPCPGNAKGRRPGWI
ncbi:MAG: hypothetical protein AVDCRST_MAG43-1101, partial [uncultured Thermomicrobiales bacterium]